MLNTIAIMGRLVADPQLRKTPNGVSTTTFTIACERNFVKAGEKRQADFMDVVAWRQTAEFASKYFRKGQLIAVNGSLQTRSYEDKQGNKRKVYEIVADNLHFAEAAKGAAPRTVQGNEDSLSVQAAVQGNVIPPVGAADDFTVIDDSEDLPF